MGVGAVIVACYICGLIAFAVGRWLSNTKCFRGTILKDRLKEILEPHGLTDLKSYKPDLLYARMWSEVAQGRLGKPVLQHLSRYWAMAATYDAVAASLIVWAFVFLMVQFDFVARAPLGHVTSCGMFLACLGAAFAALKRGAAYFKYQVEDIVAAFAVYRSPLTEAGSKPKNP